MRRFAPLVTLTLLSACVSAPKPALPRPAPVVVVPGPAPVPAGPDWRDWTLTPGDWRYARDGAGTMAAFGPRGAAPEVVLRCDPALRRVSLSLGRMAAGNVTVRTSSTARQLLVQPAGTNPPSVTATLAATDPLLDAMGFSRGRFVVEQADAAPLVVPAWAEILRVTEDCRG